MATLEKIRKRGPLVAVIIGFALLAFILGDFLNSGGNLFAGDRFRIAEVNGQNIDYREYEQKIAETIEIVKRNNGVQSLSETERDQVREYVWETMVRNLLLKGEYDALGINVSSDELFDLIQGRNVDQMVARDPAFSNPETGMFDPSRIIYFYQNMDKDPEVKNYLLNIEKQVTDNRMQRKYLNLVAKGLYISTPQAANEFKSRNYLVDFDFVGKTYSQISDSSITISNAELETYYKANKEDYEQKAARDIAYVTFDVFPSEKDSVKTLKWINEIVNEFKVTEDNKQFINFNSDNKFDPLHYKKGDILNTEVDSFLFSAEPGTIYGPYLEDGAYKLAKLIETKSLPDTVEAKHILIAIDGKSILDIERAKAVADSLKTAIEGGIDFAVVAKEYSADKTSLENGGDLGKFVEGQIVQGTAVAAYDELVDENLNKLVLVEKNYGVHIMVKTAQQEKYNKIQLGFLERKIMPSTETYQREYAKASKFAGANRNLKKFDDAISKEFLVKKTAPGLTENGTFISGLESPRQLIRWAYNAEIGNVSEVFELGNRYVIGALTNIKENGIAPLEQVEALVRIAVLKEKKAELLTKEMEALMPADLPSLALKLNAEVKEAKNISFTSFQVPGLGFEPKVIATAVTSEKGKVSKAIVGENGVYAINVKIITPAMNTENVDLKIDKDNLLRSLQTRIYPNPQFGGNGQVIDALKEAAKISDERSKFY